MEEITKKNFPISNNKSSSHLFEGPIKNMELVLIEFFKAISGHKSDKTTIIFSHIQIHGKLTQFELRDLTNFSFSTISTTLNFLVNIGSIIRNFIPGTHKFEYSLRKNHVYFIYESFSTLLKGWESQEIQFLTFKSDLIRLKDRYPRHVEFLIRRINGFLNFVECQRRSINGKKKNEFLPEFTAHLFDETTIIEFPPEIASIERNMYEYRENSNEENNSLENKIIGCFYFRKNLTQQKIEQLTNNSISAISKCLKIMETNGVIRKHPKISSKMARIYSLEYRSLTCLDNITAADERIHSYYMKFRKMLEDLENNRLKLQYFQGYLIIKNKLEDLIDAIDKFRPSTEFVKKIRGELEDFILRVR